MDSIKLRRYMKQLIGLAVEMQEDSEEIENEADDD